MPNLQPLDGRKIQEIQPLPVIQWEPSVKHGFARIFRPSRGCTTGMRYSGETLRVATLYLYP